MNEPIVGGGHVAATNNQPNGAEWRQPNDLLAQRNPMIGEKMLTEISRDEAQPHHLPGRDWYLYVGPETTPAQNMTVGFATFPEGSAPEGHVHPSQEEIIYIVSGHGELVTPEGNAKLEPGTAVYIPVGLFHATVSHGPGPLEMVTSFSPPVVPGSYEKGDDDS